MSLQKESEWEKRFDKKFPLSFFADQGLVGSGFSEIDFTLWTQEATKRAESKRLHIKSFIREFIYQREQEIAEEVEKMKRVGKRNEKILDSQYMPTYKGVYEVGFVRGGEWLRLRVLSILKH